MKNALKVGDLVQVRASAKWRDSPIYQVARLGDNGFACTIREFRFDGMTYAEQRFDTSLLVPAHIERGASYSRKQKLLQYWPTLNRTTMLDVATWKEAVDTVNNSRVPQRIEEVAFFETSGKPIGF